MRKVNQNYAKRTYYKPDLPRLFCCTQVREANKYDERLDRQSAEEVLAERAEKAAAEAAAAEQAEAEAKAREAEAKERERASRPRGRTRMTATERAVSSATRSMASTIGRQIGNALLRGLLGSMKRGR